MSRRKSNPTKGMPGGSVAGCIKKEKRRGRVRDPGAYCAAIADRIEPGWRSKRNNPMQYRYERQFMRQAVILESDVRFETGMWPRGKIRVVAKPTNLTKDGAIQVVLKGLETGETKVTEAKGNNPTKADLPRVYTKEGQYKLTSDEETAARMLEKLSLTELRKLRGKKKAILENLSRATLAKMPLGWQRKWIAWSQGRLPNSQSFPSEVTKLKNRLLR